MSSPRPSLTPEEIVFDFEGWVYANLTVIDGAPPEVLCACPRCEREKLAINTAKKAYHCLSASCSLGGWSPLALIYELTDTWASALLELRTFGVGAHQRVTVPKRSQHRPGRLVATWPPLGPLQDAHWRYLAHRRVPVEHVMSFGLHAIGDLPPTGKAQLLNGRLLIPVYLGGQAVYWSARTTSPVSKIKTINMPRSCRHPLHPPDCVCMHVEWGLSPVPYATTAAEVVLGLHLVTPGKPIVVVEGDMDAVTCGPGFVATLGARCSEQQALLIASSGASEAIVLYDGDEGGTKGSIQAYSMLSSLIPTRIAKCPWRSDPGALGRSASMEIAAQAPSVGGVPLPRRSHAAVVLPKRRHAVSHPKR